MHTTKRKVHEGFTFFKEAHIAFNECNGFVFEGGERVSVYFYHLTNPVGLVVVSSVLLPREVILLRLFLYGFLHEGVSVDADENVCGGETYPKGGEG